MLSRLTGTIRRSGRTYHVGGRHIKINNAISHVVLQAQGGKGAKGGNTSELSIDVVSSGTSGPHASHTGNVSNATDQQSSSGKESYYTIGIRVEDGEEIRRPCFLLGRCCICSSKAATSVVVRHWKQSMPV